VSIRKNVLYGTSNNLNLKIGNWILRNLIYSVLKKTGKPAKSRNLLKIKKNYKK
jgi:hypothetical protein